ncbi:MAG TPA: 23S rRNA (adenine(2503)-C(2))-methyltransferase RlmN, partial [Alphaproteobacteria bacterium]|nr:23S rRNA (adenine(2503)-C(2))-methyltransferase RlmN [Alphaproteobacteria bacterium]
MIVQSLIGLTRQQLGATLAQAGVPQKSVKMRTEQLWNALYAHGATTFDGMTSL